MGVGHHVFYNILLQYTSQCSIVGAIKLEPKQIKQNEMGVKQRQMINKTILTEYAE